MLALLRPLAVVAAVALGRAWAADPPPPFDAPPSDAPPSDAKPSDGPSSDEKPRAPAEEAQPSKGEEDTWLDASHDFVEQRIFAPVLRLDRFFSDERDIEAERSRSFLRWRSEVRMNQDRTRPAFTTGVRATLRLPGLNKQLRRLRVVIAGETRDAIDTLFPRQPGRARPIETTEEDDDLGTGDAGVRFQLWDSLLAHADLGGGVLVHLPPDVYGRVRFRWAVPVGSLLLSRTVVTGFWRSDAARFGTSAALDLERPLNDMLVARLSGSGTVSGESRGMEWGSELALVASLGARSGAQIGAGVTGATTPVAVQVDPVTFAVRRAPDVDAYRVYTRLRRDVYRRWLFLEIEPEVAWPWTLEQGRHAAWGVTFRLEVQFHGNEAPATVAPVPPEPKDPPPEPLPHAPGPG